MHSWKPRLGHICLCLKLQDGNHMQVLAGLELGNRDEAPQLCKRALLVVACNSRHMQLCKQFAFARGLLELALAAGTAQLL